jgi:hypothetical protein
MEVYVYPYRSAVMGLKNLIKTAVMALGLLLSVQASAYNGFSSEGAHFAGAAVTAGTATYLFDAHTAYHDQRAWLGCGASALFFTASELIDGNTYGNRLDIAADLLGAAVGAFGTDKWLLQPVVAKQLDNSMYLGMESQLKF